MVHISKDPDANAGYISFVFDSIEAVRVAKTLPVYEDGEVTAALDFNAAGELVGVELLNASKQMAHLETS